MREAGSLKVYTDYRTTNENVKDYEKYERTIKTINKRFSTYGYKRIKTSTFEQYDLYSKVNSSINQNEMIKVIDQNGQVLVLRPDVTIPITRQLAEEFSELPNELRYFYVQDVFRQAENREEGIESTQAGVEYFTEGSPEADAEVIALACHTLKDLGFADEIKIEIGHAGFFKQLIQDIGLTPNQLSELKNLIQSKNVVDIELFLSNLSIEKEVRDAIGMIPLLYGDPVEVSERARKLVQTGPLHETLDYLMKVYEVLTVYGLRKYIVMDLGLINHMGYYSDIIFQGFVEKFGKPVLMGGRYDELGTEFGARLPAIGFACEVESLVKASSGENVSPRIPIDVNIVYGEADLGESITIANELRERDYRVLSSASQKKDAGKPNSIYSITIENGVKTFQYKEKKQRFNDINDLLKLMIGSRGGI